MVYLKNCCANCEYLHSDYYETLDDVEDFDDEEVFNYCQTNKHYVEEILDTVCVNWQKTTWT